MAIVELKVLETVAFYLGMDLRETSGTRFQVVKRRRPLKLFLSSGVTAFCFPIPFQMPVEAHDCMSLVVWLVVNRQSHI